MTSRTTTMMERIFTCTDGFKLAGQHYNPQPPSVDVVSSASSNNSNNKKKRILMLHGWLDNSRTFWKLAPALADETSVGGGHYEIVALDLPGHGLSDHRPKDGPTVLLHEAIYYVADVLQQLEWTTTTTKGKSSGSGSESAEKNPPVGSDDDNNKNNKKITLIGHSMGAGISLTYAATFPDQIERLILLESLGPISKPDNEITTNLKRHVENRLKGNQSLYSASGNGKGPRIYPSLEAAVETRMKNVTLAPGNQYISQEAATELVTRATKTASGGDDDGGGGGGGVVVVFRHDPRLTWPSLLYTTPGQMIALQQAVASNNIPTCLLLAKDGWPIDSERLEGGKQRIQPKMFHVLDGSHHFHADPKHWEGVRDKVMEFLDS